MTGRTENGLAPDSPFRTVTPVPVQRTGVPLTAAPTSTLETDMHLVPEQMARSHLENRQREAELWRMRRVARAVRRAESAERRARLAREAAVLAVRESAVLVMN